MKALDKFQNDTNIRDHWVRRTIAYVVDYVILMIIFVVVTMIAVVVMVGGTVGSALLGGGGTGTAVGVIGSVFIGILILFSIFIIGILYWIYFDAKKGGTPGKQLMKLRVVSTSGGEVTYMQAGLRNASKIVGGIIGGLLGGMFIGGIIGALVILADIFMGLNEDGDSRQKYADRMAGTTVERTDAAENFTTQVAVVGVNMPGSAAGLSPEERLSLARDRLLLGEITENTYMEIKKSLEG